MRVGSIKLYAPNLGNNAAEITGVSMVDDLAEAIVASAQAQGDREIAIIPEGPYVVPFAEIRAATA